MLKCQPKVPGPTAASTEIRQVVLHHQCEPDQGRGARVQRDPRRRQRALVPQVRHAPGLTGHAGDKWLQRLQRQHHQGRDLGAVHGPRLAQVQQPMCQSRQRGGPQGVALLPGAAQDRARDRGSDQRRAPIDPTAQVKACACRIPPLAPGAAAVGAALAGKKAVDDFELELSFVLRHVPP